MLWIGQKFDFFKNDKTIFKTKDRIKQKIYWNELVHEFVAGFCNNMNNPNVRDVLRSDAPMYMLIYPLIDGRTICIDYTNTIEQVVKTIIETDPSIQEELDQPYVLAQAMNMIIARMTPLVFIGILQTIVTNEYLKKFPEINLEIGTNVDYFKKMFYISFRFTKAPAGFRMCINNIPIDQAVQMMDNESRSIVQSLMHP